MERRKRRSQVRREAVGLYLDALREQQELEAVGLVTEEGILVAGSGEGDLSGLADAAVASRYRSVRWGEGVLHVQRFEAVGLSLCLASAGKSVKGHAPMHRIARILGA